MKQLGYYFFKGWISLALFCYYRKISVFGLENVPKDKPVLFLSNHQNALLDILLIATRCHRKPWYLTRADVFKNKWFRPLFSFLQMLPIYRIRDGRTNLPKNQKIFDKCGELLNNGEAILLFPEANHNLRRRVRPLSKGFTRILANALERNREMDIQLVPVGQNYQNPKKIGDSAALYFGKPIAVQNFTSESNFEKEMKQAVFESLTQLTTHIENEEIYESVISKLESESASFLFPLDINKIVLSNDFTKVPKLKKGQFSKSGNALFYLFNFPIVVLWRLILKPKVPEPEFMGTYRFGFALLAYPIFYALIFVISFTFLGWVWASVFVLVHLLLSFVSK